MFLAYTPYAPIPDTEALKALLPPARRQRLVGDHLGALFAYTLLALILEQEFSVDAQNIVYTDIGQPYLPGFPVHFSLSHAKTHALCAVSPVPIGCDIETHRPVSPRTIHRVLADTEREIDFFSHWTLKESYFKLTGDLTRAFSDICFDLAGETAATADAHAHLYYEVPNCTAAIVTRALISRPTLQFFSPETLFSYVAEK